ncbi:MAG TPA: hypothetical protein VKB78_17375 [Pirellulales bacterium]|nr:hypothetical protein [Pirellulales bacterium]
MTALVVLCGCGGGRPAREAPPSISPSAAGAEALAEFDTNHDGVISGAELDKCPALKSALKRYDTNGDKKVTAANIAARIEKWQSTGTALATLSAAITLDGQPLVDASVTAEPEKFLGPEIQSATGKTDAYGNARLKVSGKPGAHYGLYKIQVSKMEGGKETIPATYNVNTQLGLEFAPDAPELKSAGYVFHLKSR